MVNSSLCKLPQGICLLAVDPPRDMMLYMEQLVSSDKISGRFQARIWEIYVFGDKIPLCPLIPIL